MGPSALRIAGLGERISALGYPVVDRGNVAAAVPETKARGHERKRYIKEISRVCTRLYQTTSASLDDGALPIVLGGDHSLSAGSVAAAAAHARRTRKKLGVIWVDAHGDMNTPESTTSGNVHGMPLAALLGPEPAELSGIAGFSPTLSQISYRPLRGRYEEGPSKGPSISQVPVSPVSSRRFLLLDVIADDLFRQTDGADAVPARPKVVAREVARPPQILR